MSGDIFFSEGECVGLVFKDITDLKLELIVDGPNSDENVKILIVIMVKIVRFLKKSMI